MTRICARSLVFSGALARLAVLTATLVVLAEPLWSQRSAKINDKDCDGFADIVIGRPKEDIGAFIDAGAATALYGSMTGLTTADSEDLSMAVLGSTLAAGDFFGASVTWGYFNDDEIADTSIGVPGRDGFFANEGLVAVVYGQLNTGLLPSPIVEFIPATATPAQAGAQFGRVMTSGDFNGDGRDDLAIGIPLQNVGGAVDAGAVEVWYGSAGGLGSPESWHQNATPMILDQPEPGDRFGAALASGDFNGDGVDDLAIGVPNEETGAFTDSGAVCILYGSMMTGLTDTNNQLLTAAGANPQRGAKFGAALAGGNFGNGSADDLAIGIPMSDVGAASDAGAVEVVYGSGAGLSGAERWDQSSAGAGISRAGDHFGAGLSSEDYDVDGFRDIVVGIPRKNAVGVPDCGSVCVMFGAVGGFSGAGSVQIHSSACGIEASAQFGYDIVSSDFDGDGDVDICIGIPLDDVAGAMDSGSVEVLYWDDTAGIFTGATCFDQATPGMASDGAQAGDAFGGALEQ